MTAILEYLGVIGTWVINRLPLISLELGAFTLLIAILLKLRIFKSARIQKWFWLVVLTKPMVMLAIISPLALDVSIFQQGYISPQVTLDSTLSQSKEISGDLLTSDLQPSVPTKDMAFQPSSFWSLFYNSLKWSHCLFMLWILGFIFLFVKTLIGFRKLSKLRQQAVTLDCSHNVLAFLGNSLGIRRLPEIRVSREISSPLLFGLFHPVIMLPIGLHESLPSKELRLMLLHELFHWKHHDTWILLFKRLIEAFFFFHPAVWYAGRRIVRASEEACDDAVVSFTGNSAGYASCLLNISESIGSQRRYALASLAVKDSAVGQRIKRILRGGFLVVSKKASLVSLSILIFVSVIGLPSFLASKSRGEIASPASNEGQIVFARYEGSKGCIWVMNADGSNQRQLTQGSHHCPAWSPDGKKIAFHEYDPAKEVGEGIFVMDADGSNIKQLTNGPDDYGPAWSPDGKRIAFSREIWEKKGDQWNIKSGAIYLMDSDGANLNKIIDKPSHDPDWSPDGKKIAFYLNLNPFNQLNQVWVMDSDGGNQRMLYDWGMSPSWSPDGKRIAFWGQRDAWNAFKSADIYVMNSDGTNVKMLTVPGPEDDMYPDWSPDGKKIVFSSKRGGSYAIHVMDADGQNIQRLTNVSAYEFEPDWTAFSYAVTPAGKLKSLWGKIKTR